MERYESYKDSGIEWIGEIPEHWIVAKIKYTSTLSGRIGWQGLTSNEYQSTGPYLITGVNFSDGSIDWESCVHIPEARWLEATQIQIENGDLLITKDGTVGKVAIVDNLKDKASLNSGVMLIRANLKSGIAYLNKFLFYLLQSDVFWSWFSEINSGNSTIIHLYQGSFENFSFPIPPLSEQYKISDFISCKTSEIDSLIWRTEKFIALLQEYRKSVISEAVTKGLDLNVPMKDSGIEWIGKIPEEWNCFKLLYALEMPITDGPHETPVFYEQGIPFISADAIKNGKVDFSRMRGYISYEYHLSCSRKYSPKPGDIYMIKSGATTGQLGYVDFDGVFDIWSPLAAIRVNNGYSSKFLFYALSSDYFQKQVEEAWSFGTQQNLSMRKLEQLKVVFPKISVQYEIANYLDSKIIKIDSLIEKKKQLVEKLQEYRKSLISECVTGKVKVPGVE